MELSYARGRVAEICRELDIPTSVLNRWRRESGAYGKNSFLGKGNPKLTDAQREIAELKKRFTDIIKSYGGLVKQSMRRKGNCWDNAVAESFFKSLKVE